MAKLLLIVTITIRTAVLQDNSIQNTLFAFNETRPTKMYPLPNTYSIKLVV